MITYVTGGARSGKSGLAQSTALARSGSPVYIATAVVRDDELAQRVDHHRKNREATWTVFEEYRNLHTLPLGGRIVVIDCVTLWLSNLFEDFREDIDLCLDTFRREIDALNRLESDLIIVSNEIGMGVHAATRSGRKFTDLQGWANQYIAAKADEVILMVSGLPLYLKEMENGSMRREPDPVPNAGKKPTEENSGKNDDES